MPRFNPGDRVRCIATGGAVPPVVRGEVYTVKLVGHRRYGEALITLDGMRDVSGEDCFYADDRFELVPQVELPKKPMWVFVFKQDGEVRAHTRFNEASAQNLKRILENSRNVHDLVCKKVSITLTEAYIENGQAGRE